MSRAWSAAKWATVAVIAAGLARLSHRSGVTEKELVAPLPGDDVIQHPTVEWTRATTIDATPAEIFPWLAQMGFGRGGWYTSVLFDLIVWQLHNPSVDVILPQHQDIEAGDIVPDGPGYAAYFRVHDISANRWIVYQSIRHPYRGHPVEDPTPDALDNIERQIVEAGTYLHFTWSWVIDRIGSDRSRLYVRTRATYSPAWLELAVVPLGLVDYFHTNTMFRGIRKRVLTHR